jgi:hypothetical protein
MLGSDVGFAGNGSSRVAWPGSLSRRTWVLEATGRAGLLTACLSTVADTPVAIAI